MRASALEFRLRILLHAVVFALGFWAPWSRFLPPGNFLSARESTWLAVASLPARNGWMSFDSATVSVLVFGIVCSSLAAFFRTWASAYLGASIVMDGRMHGGTVLADGPYRHLRNPLYLGIFLHAVALSLLMPPTGALFTVLAIAILQIRLIGGEEAFLSGSLGEPYRAYTAAVPRILPSFAARVPDGGRRPRWGQAVLGEIYVILVAASFLALGWRYNAFLLTKCVLIAFGVSLAVKGFLPSAPKTEEPAVEPGH